MTRFLTAKLRDHLNADSGVDDLVNGRVHPDTGDADPDDYPWIRIQRISGPRINSQTGPSQLQNPRYQIDAMGRSYDEAKLVFEAVRQAIQGYSGDMGDSNQIRVDRIILDDDSTLYDEDAEAYMHRADYRVWAEEEPIS